MRSRDRRPAEARKLARFAASTAIAGACAVLAGACEEAPPPSRRDAGRRARLDAGSPEDARIARPSEPSRPPVDVEVELPPGAETRVSITVGSGTSELDLVLSVDTTGSFGGEIDALQRTFVSDILPALTARAERLALAVTRFQDFPFGGFGGPNDVPFELITPLTTDLALVNAGIARLDMPLGAGGDVPESGYEALYQIATGAGLEWNGRTLVAPWSPARRGPGGGTEPGVGLRAGSLRAVLHVTDAPSHDARTYGPPAHDRAETLVALRASRLRVIGIASAAEARPHLEELALATGAVLPAERGRCRTGLRGASRDAVDGVCPLVFDLAPDGTGLSDVVVQAIADLLRSLSHAAMWGRARDDRMGFVRRIEAARAEVEPGATAPMRSDERPVDGVPDTFRRVERGVTVTFDVVLANDGVAPMDYAQSFTFAIDIVGDDTVIATRTLRVIVPRGRLPTPDAALDGGLDANERDSTSVDSLALDTDPFDATEAVLDDAFAAPNDAREEGGAPDEGAPEADAS